MSKRVDVTLRGERAERFLEIKREIEEERGHPVDKTQVVSALFETAENPKGIETHESAHE